MKSSRVAIVYSMVMYSFLLMSCGPKNAIPPSSGLQTAPELNTADAMTKSKPPVKGGSKPSDKAGEFYVALINEPLLVPNTLNDCLDKGAWSYLRSFIGWESAAEVSVIAKLKVNGGELVNDQTIPLFLVSKTDSPAAGEPKCQSRITNQQLTPWFRADTGTQFNISFERSAKTQVVSAQVDTIFSSISNLATFAGYGGNFVKKISDSAFRDLSQKLDASVNNHLSDARFDRLDYSLKPLVDNSADYIAGYEFAMPVVAGTTWGAQVTSQQYPVFRIGLIYKKSLFTNTDMYPGDSFQILTTNLVPHTGGIGAPTLKALIENDFKGIRKGSVDVTTKEKVEELCLDLRDYLSENFSRADALAVRYAFMRQYGRQVFYNANLNSDECFAADEITELKKFGYMVPTSAIGSKNRYDQVQSLVKSVVVPMRSNKREELQKHLSNVQSLRIETYGKLKGKLPSYSKDDPSWDGEGEKALDKILSFGRQSRIGCFQAPQTSNLHQISGVSVIGDQTVGIILYFFDDGLLEQVLLGEIEDVRRLGDLGKSYPDSKCELL